MKRTIIILTALAMLPLLLSAQSRSFRVFYDKYAGREGYTTVEMSGAMFKVMNGKKKSGDEDMSRMLDSIQNLIIIVTEGDSPEFRRDIEKLTSDECYTPMTTIRDGGEVVRFFVGNSGGRPSEFLMTVIGKEDNVVMNIVGSGLDVQKVSQMVNVTTGKPAKPEKPDKPEKNKKPGPEIELIELDD